jgi:serine O-acetyltransferase
VKWKEMFENIYCDLYQDLLTLPNAFLKRDPAARSVAEIVILYPGFKSICFHRIANNLWKNEFNFAGRTVSEISRLLTGIEIHPGAQIGRRVVIDHGMGVVIGETAVVGNDVLMYHGVTLGAGGNQKTDHSDKRTEKNSTRRHPCVEDNVVLGAGSSVLGFITVGKDSVVGAGAVVVSDVPPGHSCVGIPAKSKIISQKS